MHPTKLLLLIAGDLLETVSADTNQPQTLEVDAEGAYSYGTANYISDSVFDAALRQANTTGSVSFTGLDVSASWPGSGTNGWTLAVNVTSDIVEPGSDNRQTTGSAISIMQPASLSTSSDNNGTDGFQVCVNVMRIMPNVTFNYTSLRQMTPARAVFIGARNVEMRYKAWRVRGSMKTERVRTSSHRRALET
jgi:hypothetical protein